MNADTILGALIALLSLGGGIGLQSSLSDRRARHDQRIQFERDMLLDLQVALGDMTVAAEQIRFAKRAAGSWSDDQVGLPWTELITHSVQAGRDCVLIDDVALQELTDQTREAFLRLASAASETEATSELPRARDLLHQVNERIGTRVRGL